MLEFLAGAISLTLITVYFIVCNIIEYKDSCNDNIYKRFKIRETRRLIRRYEKYGGSVDKIEAIIRLVDK